MLHRIVNILKSSSFFLFGARGTGKSTLIKEHFLGENSLYINLLKFQEFSRLESDPEETGIFFSEVSRILIFLSIQRQGATKIWNDRCLLLGRGVGGLWVGISMIK